ncbi:alkaline phosphatase [Actinorhabdospora filicis]|uniref:Alkaline phosphatase n=1 Tax=Actinorhabdospora filicis TaxID=1785913 RepID=A0A9W6SHI7_9ACTN|nr:alkaline phosphatase D family protein [Actinorhabdospora filicis]GLZ76095.1 alkaline phosphatase [Actinorhabdospora filicis]
MSTFDKTGLSRRLLLAGGGAIGVAATIGAAPASGAGRELPTSPFTLGVASGDPDDNGFVLWTRLAVDPHAEDGMGGMPDRVFEVRWELAADERFRHVVRNGVATARPAWGHSVHVELHGLRPDAWYWYRFRVGRHVSPAGRTRTAPSRWSNPNLLNLAFVSCSQFEHGYFTAYKRLAETDPDLVLHLGDYQYEYKAGVYNIPGGNPRDHEGPETETLANYRQRHAQYKTDPDLQQAHAAAPWAVVFDDHEVENNWAGDIPEEPHDNWYDRRVAAFRAYYENMPLRRTSVPKGLDIQIYRRLQWGRLATFHMLDTRQFRDDQACGDGYQTCPEADNPARSITGPEQEAWLLDGFHRSDARWDVLGQQVFFAQRDQTAGPVKKTSMDAWDGYTASRRRITQGWLDAGVRNPVVLTGDVHSHWAADLKLDYDDPTSRTVGSELVCTSITSGGDGKDTNPTDNAQLKINPHVKFYNNQRGWVSAKVSQTEINADFMVVPYVHTPGAEAHVKASFAIEDRVPGVQQTYLRPVDPAAPGLRSTPDEFGDGYYGDGSPTP